MKEFRFDFERLKVYEKGGGKLLGDFGLIGLDKKYRILLEDLVGEQDSFDLIVSGDGGIEIDQIVDPNAVYDATLGAPYCSGTSPCVGTSALLQCTGNQAAPGPEINAPNTIDACVDATTSGTCQNDESVENITISDLNNTLFEAGDTVQINYTLYCWSATKDRYALYYGQVLTPEHFINWVEKFSLDSLESLDLTFIKKLNKSNEILPGGPPCLQDLLSKGALGEGSRNNGLFNIGVYLRKRFPEEWQDKLEEYNDDYIDPPLKPREFTAVLQSLDKKTYNYKCKDSPINSVCNKTKCITCEYGINDDGTMPTLNSITKILTNPPQYFLTLSEKKIGPLSSKQIYNFLDFKQVVFENLDMLLPKINDKLWTETVNDLMSRVIAVEAPKDSSNEGRLFDLLERFCTGSTSSTESEDLLRGKAIIQDEITEFRINDFMEFLDRHRFKEFKLHEITAYLKNLGATHSGKKIKGKFTNTWSIPSFQVQTEEFKQPNIRKEAYE